MTINNENNRERWVLTNISLSELAFGELPLLPTISSGESVDLLIYYEKDEIQQCKQIPMALTAGFISMQKILDNSSTDVESSDYVTVAERSIIEEIKDETTFDFLKLNPDLAANPDYEEGLIFYDTVNKCLAVYNSESDIALQVGQEQWVYVYNDTGSDLVDGQAVYISGADVVTGLPTVALAQASSETTYIVAGLTTQHIADGTSGFITALGIVNDLDTSAFAAGADVWVSAATAGALTDDEPNSFIYKVGRIVVSSATEGSIFVSPKNYDFYTKDQVNNLIAAVEVGGEANLNVLIVTQVTGSAGTTFASVEEAIDEINSYAGGPDEASTTNRYVIEVTPGTYVENNPLVVPSYVTVQGYNDEASVIQANDNASVLLTMSDDSQVYSLRTSGPANNDAILLNSGNEGEIVRVVCTNSLSGIHADGAGTKLTIEESKFKPDVITGIRATDGASISCSNILSKATTTHFYADGGNIWIQNSGTQGGTNGIYANNGGAIYPHLTSCMGTTNIIRVNNTSKVLGNTVSSRENALGASSTWDILQEDASSTINLAFCKFLATKISRVDSSATNLSFDSELEGDEGLLLYEELQVGSPERGRESVFGEGDSYIRGMLVYTETAGNVFTNVSTEAASSSGSTFTFPAIAADNAIYVSSDLQDATDYKQFLGIKASITTAAVLGAGEIVAEYWDGTAGGGSWVEYATMSCLSNSPYTEYSNLIFERVNSEQIRFDDLTDTTRFDWAKNDPPATGTNRFWVRFRVKTDVTTVPIFEQFKVHSNRTEINADGFVEYMGKARKLRKLPEVHIGNKQELVGASPANENISYGAVARFVVTDNEFANGTTDGFGQTVAIPEGLDTSLPLEFKTRWAPTTDVASGDVVLDLTYGTIKVGTVLNGANTEQEKSDSVTTTANTAEQVYESTIQFSIPDAILGDTIVLALRRQAAGSPGPTGDTYNGNIYIVSVLLQGYFWH